MELLRHTVTRSGCRAWFGWYVTAALLLAGCGAPRGFRPSFPVNRPESVAHAMARAGRTGFEGQVAAHPRALLVSSAPAGVISFDLVQRKVLWRVEGPVTSRVVSSARGLFHGAGGRVLVGRDHATGQIRWRRKMGRGGKLIGMCAAGARVYYAMHASDSAGDREHGVRAHLVALDAASGTPQWRIASEGTLGAPSAVGNLVVVPLRTQSIALVDGIEGVELARVRSRQEALLWSRATARGVFYGGAQGVYRLDPRKSAGPVGLSPLVPPLPRFGSARPTLGLSGYHGSDHYSAFDRTRALWHVPEAGPPGFLGNTVIVQYFRYLFALRMGVTEATASRGGQPTSAPVDPGQRPGVDVVDELDAQPHDQRSNLLWARSLARGQDVVGSAHTGGALVVVGSGGDVLVLDPRTGATVTYDSLGVKLRGAAIDAEGFAPPVAGTGSDLVDELSGIIRDPDRRLDPAKFFSADRLAEIPGTPATKAIVSLLGDDRVIEDLRPRVEEMVIARRDPAAIPLYAEILARRYSYVDNVQPRGLGVVARALAASGAPQAVPLLLPHLADHETPMSALPAVIGALHAAGDPSVVKPVSEFLLTYRCDPEFANSSEPLVLAARLLLDLGGAAGRKLVSFVAHDGQTLVHLRMHLLGELQVTNEPRPVEPRPVNGDAQAGDKTE